jgi:antitoxin VapB
MALNIKNQEVERLAAEVASMAGETKTQAVKTALAERRARLARPTAGKREGSLRRFLETEIWPQIPDDVLDRPPLTREERESILGYGPEGV